MAAEAPLNQVTLSAASVADDLGFVALADLSCVIGGDVSDYRVIGGHMITVLAARRRLEAHLYRERGDADLGVPPVVARDRQLPNRLKAAGYDQVAGNRFARTVTDIPVKVIGVDSAPRQAIIDVLIPAYASYARDNVKVGEDLFTTEVPGLAIAIARPAVGMALVLRRLNGSITQAALPFADELSALVLKALATQVRHKATDMTDIWRCLEITFAAGIVSSDFERSTRSEVPAIIRSLFSKQDSPGMTALIDELSLSGQAADQQFTRIRALMGRVIGSA